MKPFSRNPSCPKCGCSGAGIVTRFVAAVAQPAIPEHLVRQCDCRYQWQERCLNALDNAKTADYRLGWNNALDEVLVLVEDEGVIRSHAIQQIKEKRA